MDYLEECSLAYQSADELRGMAERETALASAAEADGDSGHAKRHLRRAAEIREAARLKEIT